MSIEKPDIAEDNKPQKHTKEQRDKLKERTLSDAELLKRGAEYDEAGRMEPTERQKEEIRREHGLEGIENTRAYRLLEEEKRLVIRLQNGIRGFYLGGKVIMRKEDALRPGESFVDAVRRRKKALQTELRVFCAIHNLEVPSFDSKEEMQKFYDKLTEIEKDIEYRKERIRDLAEIE